MEITNTVVTRSAIKSTDVAEFHTEYTEVNGIIQRIQFNVHEPGEGNDEQPGTYIGSIYYEQGQLSGNVAYGQDAPKYFETAVTVISEILENSNNTEDEREIETEKSPR